jgi:hypothetical protein
VRAWSCRKRSVVYSIVVSVGEHFGFPNSFPFIFSEKHEFFSWEKETVSIMDGKFTSCLE